MRRIVRRSWAFQHGLNGCDSKQDVTLATPSPMVIRGTQIAHYLLVAP